MDSFRPSLVYKVWERGRLEYSSNTFGLERSRLDLHCNRLHYNTIEQEVLSPVSRRVSPTCTSLLQSNPGFLTMGFAEINPRQLAPTVGKMQVEITISAVPSSAKHNSRTRARSNPL